MMDPIGRRAGRNGLAGGRPDCQQAVACQQRWLPHARRAGGGRRRREAGRKAARGGPSAAGAGSNGPGAAAWYFCGRCVHWRGQAPSGTLTARVRCLPLRQLLLPLLACRRRRQRRRYWSGGWRSALAVATSSAAALLSRPLIRRAIAVSAHLSHLPHLSVAARLLISDRSLELLQTPLGRRSFEAR